MLNFVKSFTTLLLYAGYFREREHSGLVSLLHVWHGRLQVPGRPHPARAAAPEGSLPLLLRSHQQEDALRLCNVPQGNKCGNVC